QTRLAMENIKLVLDEVGANWRDVVKVTKYLTDMSDFDGMHATLATYFGDWRPASTTLCISQLSSPGARVELDMIIALAKDAGPARCPFRAVFQPCATGATARRGNRRGVGRRIDDRRGRHDAGKPRRARGSRRRHRAPNVRAARGAQHPVRLRRQPQPRLCR